MYILDTSAKAAQLNRIDIVCAKRKLLLRVEDSINNIGVFFAIGKEARKNLQEVLLYFCDILRHSEEEKL